MPAQSFTCAHLPHLRLPSLSLPHVVADLDALAREVDRLAAEVRVTEERLRRRAASVVWESSAATAYEHRAAAHAAGLARCARLMEGAAGDLRRHGVVVRERADAVRAAGNRLHERIDQVAVSTLW